MTFSFESSGWWKASELPNHWTSKARGKVCHRHYHHNQWLFTHLAIINTTNINSRYHWSVNRLLKLAIKLIKAFSTGYVSLFLDTVLRNIKRNVSVNFLELKYITPQTFIGILLICLYVSDHVDGKGIASYESYELNCDAWTVLQSFDINTGLQWAADFFGSVHHPLSQQQMGTFENFRRCRRREGHIDYWQRRIY